MGNSLKIDKVNYNLIPIKAMKKKGDLMDHPSYQRYPSEHLEMLWTHCHPSKRTAAKVDSEPVEVTTEAKDATINNEEGD